MPNIISKIKTNNTDYGIRAGYMYYGTTTGTESTLAVTIKEDGGNTINMPELAKGMTFALTFHIIPITSATLSVNGLTGKPIHFSTGLTGREWVVGETYIFIYNGTAFVSISSYGSHTYSYINHIGVISGQWNIDELDTTNARTYSIWELTTDTNNLEIYNAEAPLNFEHYLLIRNGTDTNLEIVIALDGDFTNADIYADIDTSNSIEVPKDSTVEICYFASLDKTGKKYVTITKSAPLSISPQLY